MREACLNFAIILGVIFGSIPPSMHYFFIFFNEMFHQGVIKILISKMIISVDSYSFKNIITESDQGNIEGSSTKVKDQPCLYILTVKDFHIERSVQSRRYRLFKDIFDIEERHFKCIYR